MQRAAGRWGVARPDGRGMDSGEKLRPPKKTGKDQPSVHKKPSRDQWGTERKSWNVAAIYQRRIMLSRYSYPPKTCSSLKSGIAAGIILSRDANKIEADALPITCISPETLMSSTILLPAMRVSTRMQSPHKGFAGSNLSSGSGILMGHIHLAMIEDNQQCINHRCQFAFGATATLARPRSGRAAIFIRADACVGWPREVRDRRARCRTSRSLP